MVAQGFEEKDSFGVAKFLLGSPPSVEVQGFLVLLAFQGHTEGVVVVLDDGGLGELTIVGALILFSGLARLATLL